MILNLFIVVVSRRKKYYSIKMNDMMQGHFFIYTVHGKYDAQTNIRKNECYEATSFFETFYH
jgi:hypothetical protein